MKSLPLVLLLQAPLLMHTLLPAQDAESKRLLEQVTAQHMPDTVFRGKKVGQWLLELRDADPTYREQASAAFLAMGPKAVGVLLLGIQHYEWGKETRNPRDLIIQMGESAIADLIPRFMEDEKGQMKRSGAFKLGLSLPGSACSIANDIIERHTMVIWQARVVEKREPDDSWWTALQAEMNRMVTLIAPCVSSQHQRMRLSGLVLINAIAQYNVVQDWHGLPARARQLMTDADAEVATASIAFLSSIGLQQHPEGITSREAAKICADPAQKMEVRDEAYKAALQHQVRKQLAEQAAASTRPSPPGK